MDISHKINFTNQGERIPKNIKMVKNYGTRRIAKHMEDCLTFFARLMATSRPSSSWAL